MRKILLSLLAAFALTVNAQKQLLYTESFSVADDGTETTTGISTYHFYDKSNVNSLDLTSYSKTLYTYNDKGQVATSTAYSWSSTTGWNEGSETTYEYDDEGNLTKTTTGESFVEYSGYEYGYYSKMTTPYYEGNFKLYFNEANQLIQREQIMADGSVNQREKFTYNADGTLATSHSAYVSGEEETYPSDVTYTFNADGTIANTLTVSETRWGAMTTKAVYVYAEMAQSYAPNNLQAVAGDNNTVSLSWDAVQGATGYVVIADLQQIDVTTTSYTSGTLLDGEHTFYVQAVVDGIGRNISDVVSVTLKDSGKLPATGFKIVSAEPGEDEYGSAGFNVNLEWNNPEGASPITEYRLIYGTNSWNYMSIPAENVNIEGNKATATVFLSQYNIGTYDYDTYEYVYGIKTLNVALVYESGIADNSNDYTWDFAANSIPESEKHLAYIENFSIADDGTETSSGISTYHLYNGANINNVDLTSYNKTFFTYGTNGQTATSTAYSWSSTTGWSEGSETTYEYDAEGNLTKTTTGESFVEYSGYEYGYYSKMTTPYYEGNFKLYFNEANQLIQREQIMADGSVNQREKFTYNADGTLATSHSAYVSGEEETYPSDVTYTYNADGTIANTVTVSETRWGAMTSKAVYVYTDYSQSYVPGNVVAKAGDNNVVTLSWEAVAGATEYIVSYDTKRETVTATTLTTPSLLDGSHDFYVQAVIGGIARNASDAVYAEVKDEGKLPASDFQITGVEQGENEYGSVQYNTSVQFTLPETSSTITGYKLFYGESNWDYTSVALENVTVNGNTATATIGLSQYNVGVYNSETYEYDLVTKPLCIVISYVTGDSDKSNVAYWDFANNQPTTAITDASSSTAVPVAYYSISGSKLNNAQKGINIVKMSDNSVRKIFVK